MRLRILFVAVLVLTALAGVAPAQAATACYDVKVVVNGDALVDQADCIEL